MSDQVDYKKIFVQVRDYLHLELDYTKYTATEKLSLLLSGIAFVALVTIIGVFALSFVTSTLVAVLTDALGSSWAANLLMALLMLVVIGVIYALRIKLIVNPITRYITRLFLNPDDTERK